MIRVNSKTPCGFLKTASGSAYDYSCTKVQKLQNPFADTTLSCIYPDNYFALPVQIKGLVMQQEGIPVLGPVNTGKVPEMTCTVDTDPFTGTWDMFHYYIPLGCMWWASMDATPTYLEGSPTIMTDSNSLCFNAGTETTLYPGILEPMLETPFDNISIDAITNTDASLDGIMLTLMMLAKWRKIIDDRLNHLSVGKRVTVEEVANGLLNLTIAENLESNCEYFRITLESGQILFPADGSPDPKPVYQYEAGLVHINGGETPISISSGTVYLESGTVTSPDDTTTTVEELFQHKDTDDPPVSADGFTLYLKATVEQDVDVQTGNPEGGLHVSGSVFMGARDDTPTNSTSGGTSTVIDGNTAYSGGTAELYFPIGGVRLVESNDGIGHGGVSTLASKAYKIYEIWQADCLTDISIDPAMFSTDPGVLYYTGAGYEVPYIIVPTATCDEDETESS